MTNLAIVPAETIREILDADPLLGMRAAEQGYRSLYRGEAVNPPSAFLLFPGSKNRIISLQAYCQDPPAAGCKLISSWPENIRAGRPRASAVIVLNDVADGHPLAVLEGAQISSSRTAGSAVLGAKHLIDQKAPPRSASVIGGGVIAARTCETLAHDKWDFEHVSCFDLDPRNAQLFVDRVSGSCGMKIEPCASLEEALDADLVVLTTNVSTPYIMPPYAFKPGQIILNISLRDIAPELLLAAENVVDDIDHCLRAGTSPHLAEVLIGDRRFVTGTLGDVMAGVVQLDRRKPIVFSPFGLGILDLLLAHEVWQRAEARGTAIHVEGFNGGDNRWG